MKLIISTLMLSQLMSVWSGYIDESYHPDENLFTYKLDLSDLNEAVDFCDSKVYCAGVSSSRNSIAQNNKTGTMGNNTFNEVYEDFYAHSFLPAILEEHAFQSNKPYTIHSAYIVDTENIFHVEQDMTLTEAKDYCFHNSNCVAFFFYVYSNSLKYIDEVHFVNSITEMEESEIGDWRTYIINDVRRSSQVNENSIDYFTTQDSVIEETQPYRSCCQETEIPDLEEIREMDTLKRISCDISREEFIKQYEEPRIPTMLVGCDEHWPAKHIWSRENFLTRFDNSTKWREMYVEDDNEHKYISELLEYEYHTDTTYYIFDQLDHDYGKELEREYDIPKPVQGGNLYQGLPEFPEKDYGSLRWFCLGARGTGTLPHDDPVSSDAWNSVLQGHKWWILYPNSVENAESIECDAKCSLKNYPNKSELWFGSIGINAMRTEYANGKTPMIILQKPGETIYVPNGYIHSVFNLDDTIAITANYGSVGNLLSVWKELLDSGSDQHAYHAYYKNFNKEQRRLVRESPYWPIEEGRALLQEEIHSNEKEEDDEEEDDDIEYEGDDDIEYEEDDDVEYEEEDEDDEYEDDDDFDEEEDEDDEYNENADVEYEEEFHQHDEL